MATLSRPFSRLLIANRGEIAVRIASTAHRLGLSTVGVHSDPDADALHVDAVDRSIRLPGSAASDTYLRADSIIEAALRTDSDAVHPGYGFLAENADFAQAVLDAGLVWVGPTPDQIRLLGDKVQAKEAAIQAGVPTTEIIRVDGNEMPADIPRPALVKAAAGGGGRGMRIVTESDDLAEAIASAAREAEANFGDPTVFVEPYVERGRHVEVQIVGDTHGNVVHLGDRDCSIQRRNQKVIEEAPAPGLEPETREKLATGAVALARATGYQGAGTVEFLVGADGSITFLEVNTRLQVEHPVTEAITGVDIVEWQLRIAAGEALPLPQDRITFTGHAIEARLVAEDPAAGWLPATGTIDRFEVVGPVRVDSGVRDGQTLTSDYDSLIAKVIAHAPTRAEAARLLARSLRTTRLAGVATNLTMLAATLDHHAFHEPDLSTRFLVDHPELVAAPGPTGDDELALVVAATLALDRRQRLDDEVTGFAPSGWRNLRTRGQRRVWTIGGRRVPLEYLISDEEAEVLVGDWPEPADDGALTADERRRAAVRLLRSTDTEQVVELDGIRYRVDVGLTGERAMVHSAAGSLDLTLAPVFVDHTAEAVGGGPICPLPGTVLAVAVEAGQTVADGELLVVVEAMKMEHRITSIGPAVVTEVLVAVGDRVDAGDLLVRLDAGGEG